MTTLWKRVTIVRTDSALSYNTYSTVRYHSPVPSVQYIHPSYRHARNIVLLRIIPPSGRRPPSRGPCLPHTFHRHGLTKTEIYRLLTLFAGFCCGCFRGRIVDGWLRMWWPEPSSYSYGLHMPFLQQLYSHSTIIYQSHIDQDNNLITPDSPIHISLSYLPHPILASAICHPQGPPGLPAVRR